MRTAIVYDYVPALSGGAERALLELIAHFPSNSVEVFFGFVVDSDFSRKYIHEIQNRIGKENVHVGPKVKYLQAIFFRIMNFLLPSFLHGLNLTNFDLVISYTAFIAHAIVPPEHGKHILFMNTPARFLWNLDHAYSILKQMTSQFLITDVMRFRSQLYDLDGVSRVSKVVAISEAVTQRIQTFYNRDACVLYPASIPDDLVKTNFYRQDIKNDVGEYFTHVSRIESYKNIDLLLELALTHKIPEKIVIMGDGPYLSTLKRKVRKLGKKRLFIPSLGMSCEQYGNIIFTGFIEEKMKMHVLATASASFSLNDEDFGITKVEPLAVGTPVIGLNAGATPEIVTDGVTGILFEENTPESLLEAIRKHRVTNYKKDLLKSAAKRFTVSAFHANLEKILNA